MFVYELFIYMFFGYKIKGKKIEVFLCCNISKTKYLYIYMFY